MLDLPAIKKLCEAATAEPWKVITSSEGDEWYFGHHVAGEFEVQQRDTKEVIAVYGLDQDEAGRPKTANADFIAQARTLVPQLVEALEEAQQRSDAIEGRLSEIVEECEEVGEDPSYLFSILGESE